MAEPILNYETPPDRSDRLPQPVGRRALIAACIFCGAGAVGAVMEVSGIDGGGAAVLIGAGCLGAAVTSIAALGEALFFPRHVSDRPKAFAAAAVNLAVALLMGFASLWAALG